ncbi:MAG: glycogen debranching protein [Gammaproteobacteria bacterium]|nr:glycogen debranching protein [Gammaproteobacteria bacterium]
MQMETPSDIYQQSIDLLYRCSTSDGFLATPTENTNYRRIWARDGVIIGLASLLSEERDLIHTMRQTLLTLKEYQGPHGEIPSNVDPISGRISFGGTTGRVDADLWFIIGCVEYWLATGDDDFLEHVIPAIEKVRFLLGAWEFNNRGLLYVPQAGDWADEYLHAGYVLYDQLLYLQAQRAICQIHAHVHGSPDHDLLAKADHLKHLIKANYWLSDQGSGDDIYHEILYEKGLKSEASCRNKYWMPFFSPTGYGYRFDAFANILASLFNLADDKQVELVDTYIDNICAHEIKLIPAFDPVIQPVDEDWKDLQMTFSFTFKNRPFEFHNGGRWPMLTGFYVSDLCNRGQTQTARAYSQGINTANAMPYKDHEYGFAEFIHGQDYTPGGTAEQGWSAAATIIAHQSLEGKRLFRINE